MASVLTVQALFFADGGLLALGCNIFNLAFFPCFVAYPFIYRIIVGSRPGERRIFIGAILSAVVGLQFGALAVVVETVISGITELPLTTFAYLMQPIHLAIGVVEGFVTAGIVLFISKARPEILHLSSNNKPSNALGYRKLLAVLLAAAIVSGGALSWFASDQPDGLEWTIAGITGSEEIEQHESRIHEGLARIQETVSMFPDYGFKNTPDGTELPERWPAVKKETSFAGLAGGALTLFVTGIIGFLLKRRRPIA
jgi:cobalt/nickel transport system permease protein